jgi:SAM-dependent methyltransferase
VDVHVRERTAHPTQRFDGVTLPFADKAFDTSIAMFVLHHAADQDGLLREMGRVARRVIIGEDVLSNPIERLLGFVHIRSSGWGGSVRGFRTDTEWRATFASLGWRLVEAVRIPRWKSLAYPVPRRVYVVDTV